MSAFDDGFRAGVRSTIDMALVAAITIEIRDDASEVRQRASIAALRGLADGLKDAFIDPPGSLLAVFRAVADDPAQSGVLPCPTCAGRLMWVRDSRNGHLRGHCETAGCLRWIQ